MGDSLIIERIICVVIGLLIGAVSRVLIVYENRHKKKQIAQANKMIIDHLRSYIIDNGLPPREIIDSVKASIAREYNVRYDKLFTTKILCEEIIKDIIGNSYILNYNQKKYIDMLANYLKQDDDLVNDNNKSFVRTSKLDERIYNLISAIVSIMAGIVTILSTFLII